MYGDEAKMHTYSDVFYSQYGNFVCVLDPKSIDATLAGDIPLLETTFPIIVIKHQKRIWLEKINTKIQGNSTMVFVKKGVSILVKRISPEETTCSGKFCGKLSIFNWIGQKGGKCYNMAHRR